MTTTTPIGYYPGTGKGRAKLTAEQVAEIRAAFKPRVVTQKHLARKYGVSVGCIGDVLKGRTWNPARNTARPRREGKMRYAPGDKLRTMEILDVVEETSSYKTTVYRVKLICGCEKSVIVLNGHQIYGREKKTPLNERIKEFRCQHCRGFRPAAVRVKSAEYARQRRARQEARATGAEWAMSLIPAVTRNLARVAP